MKPAAPQERRVPNDRDVAAAAMMPLRLCGNGRKREHECRAAEHDESSMTHGWEPPVQTLMPAASATAVPCRITAEFGRKSTERVAAASPLRDNLSEIEDAH